MDSERGSANVSETAKCGSVLENPPEEEANSDQFIV